MARPRKAGFFIESEALDHWRFGVAGAAGTGVWSFAGAWSDKNLTDGHVPRTVAERLLPGARAVLARVTRSGLWSECTEHDACFHLHRYTEDGRGRKRQPKREEVLARQAAERDRKRAIPVGKVPVIREESARNPQGTIPLDTTSSLVVPPLSPPQGEQPPQAAARRRPPARAQTLPDDFEVTEAMRVWASENVPKVDLNRATLEWATYWRGKGATMKDWSQAWRNGMLKVDSRGEYRRANIPPAAPSRPMADFN